MRPPSEGNDGFPTDAAEVHGTQYDPASNQELVTAILEAVAVLEERPVDSFRDDPIHESVDIEAVETLLFGPLGDGVTNAPTPAVAFEYLEYRIHIHGDGRIIVSEAGETTE